MKYLFFLVVILGIIKWFTWYCIKLIIDMAKLCYEENYFSFLKMKYSSILSPVNEESDSFVCESIDEISKQELENYKKYLKSKLTDIDYETYIKQFWVGLLEGDGTITVSCPGPNHIKVRMVISIKNLRENVIMLLLIQEVLYGTVKIKRKAQYVT